MFAMKVEITIFDSTSSHNDDDTNFLAFYNSSNAIDPLITT